jgi:hypothetical protein
VGAVMSRFVFRIEREKKVINSDKLNRLRLKATERKHSKSDLRPRR